MGGGVETNNKASVGAAILNSIISCEKPQCPIEQLRSLALSLLHVFCASFISWTAAEARANKEYQQQKSDLHSFAFAFRCCCCCYCCCCCQVATLPAWMLCKLFSPFRPFTSALPLRPVLSLSLLHSICICCKVLCPCVCECFFTTGIFRCCLCCAHSHVHTRNSSSINGGRASGTAWPQREPKRERENALSCSPALSLHSLCTHFVHASIFVSFVNSPLCFLRADAFSSSSRPRSFPNSKKEKKLKEVLVKYIEYILNRIERCACLRR